MKCKRGSAPQSSTQWAAALVGLIALYLLIYFFLLPKETQQELLGEKETAEGETQKEVVKTLLIETPGMVYPYTKETSEKKISSVNLFSTLKTDVKTLANSLSISSSIISKDYQDLPFELTDLESIKKLDLFFDVREHKGELVVYLNDNEIFSGEVRGAYDLPIELPTEYLQAKNILRIQATSPGWKFLTTNYYELRDVKIIKNYQVENKRESRNFVLDEKKKISDAKLSFFVNCLEIGYDQGTLKVDVNRFNIYTSRVICDAGLREVDIPLDYLNNGQNMINFEIDKGDYIIEQIELESRLESEEFPTYYFMLSEEDLEHNIELKMEFEPDVTKRATIMVNGKKIYLDTKVDDYEKDITEWLREGENYIKIVPSIEFNLMHLEVSLVESKA